MNDLSQAIEHLRAAQPHMKAMGDALDRYAQPAMTIAQCLSTAQILQGAIHKHSELYADSNGNLEESARLMADVCLNLTGHLRDIKDGVEE